MSKYNKKYLYAQPIFYYFGLIPSSYSLFGTNIKNTISLSNGYLPKKIDYDYMNSFIIVPKRSIKSLN
nr:hypothetical protein GTC16762_31900 [Pigmentibacter ruber]